jgi:hypothetical protein
VCLTVTGYMQLCFRRYSLLTGTVQEVVELSSLHTCHGGRTCHSDFYSSADTVQPYP